MVRRGKEEESALLLWRLAPWGQKYSPVVQENEVKMPFLDFSKVICKGYIHGWRRRDVKTWVQILVLLTNNPGQALSPVSGSICLTVRQEQYYLVHGRFAQLKWDGMCKAPDVLINKIEKYRVWQKNLVDWYRTTKRFPTTSQPALSLALPGSICIAILLLILGETFLKRSHLWMLQNWERWVSNAKTKNKPQQNKTKAQSKKSLESQF